MLDLTGVEFKGNYQRRSDLVSKMHEHRAKLKMEQPDLLPEFDRIWGSSDTEAAIVDRKYDFTLVVLEHDPSTGFFIGKSDDQYGKSGVVGGLGELKKAGKADYYDIEFLKVYCGKISELAKKALGYEAPSFEDRGILNVVRYNGKLLTGNEDVTCAGTYRIEGFSENYDGEWSMKAISRKVAPTGRGFTVEG